MNPIYFISFILLYIYIFLLTLHFVSAKSNVIIILGVQLLQI